MSNEITRASISAAKIFVGVDMERVMGAADEYFSVETDGDIGAVVKGAQGDTMHVGMTVNAYTMSLQLIPASSAVGLLLRTARQTGNAFPIAASFNDFSLNGIATVINIGAWTASATPGTRTMTLGISKITGNTETGIGEVLQVVV
jgi:hypothetical protein